MWSKLQPPNIVLVKVGGEEMGVRAERTKKQENTGGGIGVENGYGQIQIKLMNFVTHDF